MSADFIPPPIKHMGSSFLHHHHHRGTSPTNRETTIAQPTIFKGTDAVPQNQKVAVQRIVEIHDALERKHLEDTASERRHDSAELSVDSFNTEFDTVNLPNGEVRAFKYFLRMWDQNEQPDHEFEGAVGQNKLQFEQVAIKHFFRRIALWNESEEILEAAKREKRKLFRWNSIERDGKDSQMSRLSLEERTKQEHIGPDELKKTTTREGLAQLLWTLMHDVSTPLAPELTDECKAAVKWSYGIKC